MANKDSSELIRPGTAAFDRWMLPSFGESAHVVPISDEPPPEEMWSAVTSRLLHGVRGGCG